MEPSTRRTQLTAQLAELHEQQMESIRAATFTGWTAEEKAEHMKRADQIAALTRELGALT